METKRLSHVAVVVIMMFCTSLVMLAADGDEMDQFYKKKFHWGPRAGIEMMKISPSLMQDRLGGGTIHTGVRGGLGMELRLLRWLNLNADVVYTVKGFSCRHETFEADAWSGWIEVPLYVSIHVKRCGDFMFKVNGGYFYSRCVAGKISRSDLSYKYDYRDEFGWNDFGFYFGGKVYYKRYLLDIGYDVGLIDLGGPSGLDFRNRSLSVTLGYNF